MFAQPTPYVKLVGILEDNNHLRGNIEYYLKLSGDYVIAFSAPSVENINSLYDGCMPDYILLDIHLNGKNSLDSIEYLKEKFPAANIIIITGDINETLVLRSFALGAKGFLYKPFNMNELLSSLQQVETYGSFMAPSTASLLISQINRNNEQKDLKSRFKLTAKEVEIIQLVKEGHSYKKISGLTDTSYHTVNHHMKNIYHKMNINSRAELVAKYILKLNIDNNGKE